MHVHPSLYHQPSPRDPSPQTFAVGQAALAAGITLVSVGHRVSLRRFHNEVLNLAPVDNGSLADWTVTPVEAENLATAAQSPAKAGGV